MPRPTDALDLRELALKPGERCTRVFPDLQIAPVSLGGLAYEVAVRVGGATVTVNRIVGGYLLDIEVPATVYGPCCRCLEEAALSVEASQAEYVPQRVEEWADADVSPYVDEFVVDVGALAREAVVLSIPAKVLCSLGCGGLCAECGRPLTSAECGCSKVTTDPRWAALAQVDLEPDED